MRGIGRRAGLAILIVTLFVATAVAQEEKVLGSFNGSNGARPYAGLIFDASGNLYGTTNLGGTYNAGTVFQVSPRTGGGWKETVLRSFNGADGENPFASLIFDAAGDLYGTTGAGGADNAGTVFELMPNAGRGWKEKVVFSFTVTDGNGPYASLIFDPAGNLYGTTVGGGAKGYGTVFELTPNAGGGWKEKVLRSFDGADGENPFASLIFDAAGSLYGTTETGGADRGGVVFELTPSAGSWTETVLYDFSTVKTTGTIPKPVWSSMLPAIFSARRPVAAHTETGPCSRPYLSCHHCEASSVVSRYSEHLREASCIDAPSPEAVSLWLDAAESLPRHSEDRSTGITSIARALLVPAVDGGAVKIPNSIKKEVGSGILSVFSPLLKK